MNNKSLRTLYDEHQGNVSDKWTLYLTEYNRLFQPYREKRISMLEIGVQNGGSLEIWSKYFEKASALIGCDINPDCARLMYDDQRISLIVGDANEPATRERILAKSSKFDIIIDDGSHVSSDIVKSFALYFSVLEVGGLFIAEDLHCSYWHQFEGGLFDPYSSITFFKSLADVINHEHWGVIKSRGDILAGIFSKYGCDVDSDLLAQVHSVEFLNSMCVVRKAPAADNILGSRIIAGSVELVVPGHHELQGKPYRIDTGLDQSENFWSAGAVPPAEEYPNLLLALSEIRQEVLGLGAVIAERDEHILNLGQNITERDKKIIEKNAEITRLDKIIPEKDRQLAKLNHDVDLLNAHLSAVYLSSSWKMTQPIRTAFLQLKRIKLAATLLYPAVERAGGISNAIRKAAELISREGFSGIKRGFKVIAEEQGAGQSRPLAQIQINGYAQWIRGYELLPENSAASMALRMKGFKSNPIVSIVMPTYNSNPVWLQEAIESVISQTYPFWELCIADDASTNVNVRVLLEKFAQQDSRIKLVLREKNGHISAASNSALKIATGTWVALLDHDDLLSEHALFWIVNTINEFPDSRLIYSDEDKLDENGKFCMPFFKPDWSPHLMLSQAYLGHLVTYQKTLLDEVGGFNVDLNGAQDFALALSCAQHMRADQVQHIPRVLYHWRMHAESTAKAGHAKPYAHIAGLKAVDQHIAQNYPGAGMIAEDGEHLFTYKATFTLPPDHQISIIIPTKDGLEYLKPCVDSIFNVSTWKNIQVIILDNNSVKQETAHYLDELKEIDSRVTVIAAPIPFNWSKLNNIGARHATGQTLLFLNNDTQVISPGWLESLAGYACLPNVGVVGGLLLFEDETIQHSGVVVGMGGWADHVYRTLPARHTGAGPFVSPVLTRNVLAVTGACMAISRKRYEELGGFDEAFVICGSDVELGLRAHKMGYFNVMCAEAKMYHYESKTRTPHVPDEDFIQSATKYAPYRQEKTDPFYSRNLSLKTTNPTIDEAPRAA